MVCLALNTFIIDSFEHPPRSALNHRVQLLFLLWIVHADVGHLFEITLGNWVPFCWLLMASISVWYGLVFLVHKLLVGLPC